MIHATESRFARFMLLIGAGCTTLLSGQTVTTVPATAAPGARAANTSAMPLGRRLETTPTPGGGFASELGGPRSVFMAPYPEYRIGPQDLIDVDVYEAPEFRRSVRVSHDGTVRLPLCKNPIELAGLTYVEAEQAVAKGLVEEGLLIDPIVAVNVREPHGNPVHVTGSVRQPVVFPAVGPTTLLDAIAQAGGLSSPGREIVITRPGGQGRSEETIHIPSAEFRDGLNGAQSVPLFGGETVRVVPPEKAFLMGAINQGGTIEITDPEGMEFLKVLASAGGLDQSSNNKAIILRGSDVSPAERERITVDVKKVLKFEVFDVRIQPGDVVYFPSSRGKEFMYRMADAAAFQVLWRGMAFLWR